MAVAVRMRSRRPTLRRGLVAVFALAAVFEVGAWFNRDLALRTAADLWIVSDPIGPADAVAVLGGGVEDRPVVAAHYYKDGLVKKILISNAHEGPAEKLDIIVPGDVANREVLLRLGVPASAIETFGEHLRNTYQEAVALRNWAERTGARSLIVPTEIFSARRVRWTFHRVFRPDMTIRVPAVDPPGYSRDNWWRHGLGVHDLAFEFLKYLYYRIKY